MSLYALLLAAAAPSETPPLELLPSGKWQVEYAKSSCIISRAFGEKPNLALFGLKPAPYSEYVTMLVMQPSQKGRMGRGVADIKLSGGFVPETANYTSVIANGTRVTMIELPRITLDALAKGESIAIKAGKPVNVALRPTGFDKALKALEDCESDLLVSWGFSREAQAEVAERPKGSLVGVIRSDDYPTDLVMRGIRGTVGVRLRIEPDETISECFVAESSGHSDLDKHTCSLAKKRARYKPAIGRSGNPIWSFTFARVTWMIED